MVIISRLTDEDWILILSALKSEANNNVMAEIFPSRQKKIIELIKKLEQGKSIKKER